MTSYPWYDSVWLSTYVTAQEIIRSVKPSALPAFVDAFRVLRTHSGFRPELVEHVFDDATFSEIRGLFATLRPREMELHEIEDFGRFVVHDHPMFARLHEQMAPRVGELVGEALEPSYNFLSLYGPGGVCEPHLDSPDAKYTLDVCIDQHAPWPIYFSQVCEWPETVDAAWSGAGWVPAIKQAPSLHFTPWSLEPGQAIVFSGSGQFHYREPIAPDGGREFCHMLFFHFRPRGTSDLLRPETWAGRFGVPELETLTSCQG